MHVDNCANPKSKVILVELRWRLQHSVSLSGSAASVTVLRSIFWFASQGKSKLKFTSLEEIALEIFNYLNVMIAILLGVGLFQIFGGIGRLLQIRHRVKPYWLHSLWVLILIMAHAHLWWSFWGLRDAVRWNYVEFLYLLIGPAGLVIISQVIIPGELYGELHDQKFDLRRHYYDISHLGFQFLPPSCRGRYFWNWYWASDPLFVEFRILQALALVAIGACAPSKRPIVHTIGVSVVSALLAVVVFLIRFRPRGV